MKQLLLILTLLSTKAFGQTAEDEVKQPIVQFFEGMRLSDSTKIKGALSDSALLQTIIKTKEGKTIVRSESLTDFIVAVTKPHTQVYDERITFGAIHIDGDLASVWTPYQFYVGEKFSHCGVNSFQLVRVNGEWKIQYIIDTRRKENCQ